MTKRVLVPIATGFEEIETLTMVDILRRAGADVVVAGVDKADKVVGRSNVTIAPDTGLDEALTGDAYDLVFLPGGLPNAHILRDDQRIQNLIKAQIDRGGYLSAICAAPLALESAGVIKNRQVTSHPSIEDQLRSCHYSNERVVVSSPIITSRAPGTAMELAFKWVEVLYGEQAAQEINQGVLARLQ